MSASKARLVEHAEWLAAECDRLEGQVVFLLNALVTISRERPEVAVPDLGGNRFPERIWRQVSA